MDIDIFSRSFLRNAADFQELYMAMLKGGLNKPARDNFGRVAAHFVKKRVGVRVPDIDAMPPEGEERDVLKRLARIGYAYIPDVFSAVDIAEIRRFSQDKIVDVSAYGREAQVPFAEVPAEANFAHFRFQDIGRCLPIYRVVHDACLIRTVARYLGAPPTIGIISLWWSYAPPGPPEGMQMFHHDRGDFRSCNLFVYLSDVDMGTGPHGFVEHTHEIDVLAPFMAQRFATQPEVQMQFWRWMENHRKTDEDVHRFFPEDKIKFHVGPQGTSFLEDTRGLHKGTRPATGPRFAFEIFYAVMPKYNEAIMPLSRAALDLPADFEADSERLDPLVRYATRQFYI